jgi:hypothetical protein
MVCDGIVYFWMTENGEKTWGISHNEPVPSIDFSSKGLLEA